MPDGPDHTLFKLFNRTQPEPDETTTKRPRIAVVYTPQAEHSYQETKTLLKHHAASVWRRKNRDYNPQADAIRLLDRGGATTIYRLRTGHCGLRAHSRRLGLAESRHYVPALGQTCSDTPWLSILHSPAQPDLALRGRPQHEAVGLGSWPRTDNRLHAHYRSESLNGHRRTQRRNRNRQCLIRTSMYLSIDDRERPRDKSQEDTLTV